MTSQVTIIGLGQIGASMGLALADHKERVLRVGADADPSVANQAKKMNAIDKLEMRLERAVSQADVVVLALPLDQLREMLTRIAPSLKEGAVVLDTSPVKEAVISWAQEVLPPGRSYLGLTPALNPQYLHDHDFGIEAAHADLFRDGLLAIISPAGTSSEAFRRAAEFVSLLGAQHLFVDPVEVDGLMAATHTLPQLMAAALLNITVDQPGWRDARMFTGSAYAQVTAPLARLDETAALTRAATLTNQHLVRSLNSIIAALSGMRDDLSQQNEAALHARLEQAHQGRLLWWKQRQAGHWDLQNLNNQSALPSAKDLLGGFGTLGSLLTGKKRKSE